MTELFLDLGKNNAPLETVTKAVFAAELGFSKSRVTQLVAKGMPTTAQGRIPRRAALAWYEREIAPHRRKALRDGPSAGSNRAELDGLRIERERLALARDQGELVERSAVRRAVFGRARADRDALIGFAARAASTLAAELDADPAVTFAALDRLIREHLAERAETPAEAVADDL